MLGYLNTPVFASHHISVGSGHTLYVEEAGKPQGCPVVFLHGGPGGQVGEASRRFFDPEFYRIILVDQRGCGKSQPFLSLEANTVLDSVADLEIIRQTLNIEDWHVFGGSYGSTLALTYAIHHAERVKSLILRGIFLGRQEDSDWLFQFGASEFYPEAFALFRDFIPQEEQDDLVAAYYRRMIGENQDLAEEAMKRWSAWEGSVITLRPNFPDPDAELAPVDRSLGLLEAHYFANKMFWGEDNYILNRAHLLKDIPMSIFHGRYDVDCRPSGAYALAQACPHAKFQIVEEAGHSPQDAPLFEALLGAMEAIKQDQMS